MLLGRFEVEVDGSIGDGSIGDGGGKGGRAMNPTVKEFELVDASRGNGGGEAWHRWAFNGL